MPNHATFMESSLTVLSPLTSPKQPREESTAAPVAQKPRASTKEHPLGATLLAGGKGVAFSVWAPNAETVSVVGEFNSWKAGAHPLERNENGTWSGIVSSAREGQEYRYALQRGEAKFTRVDPRAIKVTNSIGNGVVWAPQPRTAAPFKAPTLDRLIVYELHIGTFNAVAGEGPGTFASAIAKLPYLRDLGINAIEVMPIAEFAGDRSWGYNPAHPWAVETAYGGPEGFKAFVDAAHREGIAVILDVVYNHFGPGDLSLWQFDGWSENNLGGIYFYNDWRASTPWGESRPDYGRGEVRSYIRDNALMWLNLYGVDGLRWDATVYVRSCSGKPHDPGDALHDGWSLCQWLNNELRRARPGFITIAEDLRDDTWIVKDTGGGGAGFSAQWDGAFVHPVRASLLAAEDQQRDLNQVISALRCRYEDDAFRRVIYSESHDEVANGKARLPSEIDPSTTDSYPARKRSVLGAVLTFTAPGVPMLFQGQEFLEDGWFRDEVPVDWAKLGEHAGIHALYRDLVHLRLDRNRYSAGLCGQHLEINHVNHAQKILGYRRWSEGGAGDDVMIVINFSAQPVDNYTIGVPTGGTWCVRLNTDSTAYSGDFADQGPATTDVQPDPHDGYTHRIITVALAPYSALILSQNRC